MNLDNEYTPEYVEALRGMSPEQKLQAATRLYHSARDLKAGWLRQQYPDWTEEQINDKVRRMFLYEMD